MIIGLQSRKEKRVKENMEETMMKNLASKIQCERLKLWRKSLLICLILSVAESDIIIEKPAKVSHIQNWMMQAEKRR